jgi:hypothetical protein
VGLAEAVEADAIGAKPLKVSDGRSHALSAEAIKRPDKQDVEFSLRCGCEEPPELLALVGALAAALVIDVFAHNDVAHTVTPCSQLDELVLWVLALIVGGDPGVDVSIR